MHRISEFYDIVIYMYYRDYAPPHFHAIYGGAETIIDIDTSAVSEGKLPRRASSLVTEWAAAHRDELRQNWELARTGQPLNDIAPLE